MAITEIKKWIGGIGNNLEQISNAIYFAKQTRGKFICNINHYLLNVPTEISFGNNIDQTIGGSFTNIEIINKKLDINNYRFNYIGQILQNISKTLFCNISIKYFNGLVIHIRAGNIYKKPECGPCLIQAPINFFQTAVETLNLKQDILILTKENIGNQSLQLSYPNPITAAIIQYCKNNKINYSINKRSVQEAIGYLLGAKQAMLTGYTTFSRLLLLSNSKLENIIIPSMTYWPHDEISFKIHPCTTHYFDINNYITKWNRQSIKKQYTHPKEKIIYRRKI